jgi:subtilisin family serine protease
MVWRNFLLILLSICALPSLAQNLYEPTREHAPPTSDFWQSKQGNDYIQKKQYKGKLTVLTRFYGELLEGQKSLLLAYDCEIIGYKGDQTYLMRIPVRSIANLQKLPFIATIADFQVEQKAISNFDIDIPQQALQSNSEVWLDVLTVPNMSQDEVANDLPAGAILVGFYSEFDLARVKIAKKSIKKLLEKAWVIWADYVMPNELHNQFGVTTTRAGSLQFQLPQLTGKGVHIGVWDGSALIGPHIDFVNRTSQEEPLMGEPFGWREHATHVSGTMASAGLRFIYGRGIAPEAKLFNYNIISTSTPEGYIPYEMLRAVEQSGIVITQNSYGPAHACLAGGIPYSATNRSQDLVANAFPELLHVFAAGNNGSACGGYRNTVNGAKNIISVASLNDTDQRMWLAFMQSAGGPTRDGRLQPHLAAPGVEIFSTTPNHFYANSGWSGTSMAAPHVSGIAALLYQRYRELHGGQNPPAALIRAVLLNGANDLGNPGPDYVFGYGKVNAVNSAAAITENRFWIDAVAQSQSKTHHIYIPPGSLELKVMLSWNDPAALPSTDTTPSLVNNLNLQAKSPSGTIVLPLTLNPAAPANVAVQGVDNLNNNEQIVINLPESGTWEITVTGATIAMGSEQSYALTWQTENEFLALRNPTTTERDISTVHWDSRAISGNVTIEFFDGSTWTTLGTAPASQGRFNWTPPAIVTNNARIRISATGASGAIHSETSPALLFLGTPNITPNPNSFPYTAGNNSLTFSWTPASGADAYEILWLNLQKGAWEVIATVPSSVTTYTVTGLENGIRHWLSVRVRNNTLNASGIYAYAGFGTPMGAGASQDLQLAQVAHQIPTGGCLAPMQPLQVKVTLANKGTAPIPAGTVISLAYRVDNGIWTTENFTLPSELAVNQTIDYTFAQTFTPSVAGEVSIEAKIEWTADLIFTNNSRTTTVQIPPVPIPVVSAQPSLASCTVPTLVNVGGIPDDGYQLSPITFQAEDMSAATEIAMSNDGVSDAIPIGFPFKFYNHTFENVYVSPEGFLTFRNVDFDYVNFLQRAIPNTLIINDFIALAWKNMRFVAGSKVRYQTLGTAPQRKFVVEFLDMAQESDHSKRLSGQIVLYESFNRIELHIARLDASPIANVISGIENREGTLGIALPGMNNQILSADLINQSWAFTPTASGFQWLDNSSTSTTRLFTAAGTYRFRYEHNGCVTEQDVIVCHNVPTIAHVSDITTPEDTPISIPINISYGALSETLLTITQTSNNPALIPNTNLIWIGTGAARQLQIIPSPNQYGTAQITITATDGTNTATRIFQVTVTPVNDLPIVSNFTVDLFENSIKYFTATLFSNQYSDVESSPMSGIKIVSLPLNGQLLFNSSPVGVGMFIAATQISQLAYQPNLNYLGTDSFQWTASDGTAFATTPATVNLRIFKRPEPILPIPTIDVIPNVTTLEDEPVSVPVRITYGELSDEQLSIQVFADNSELLPRSAFRWIGNNANRRLIISPAANRFGNTQVTIVVSNGKNGAVRKFNISVLPVNDAPIVRNAQVRVKSERRFTFSPIFFDSLYFDIENESLAQIRLVRLPQHGRLMVGERIINAAPELLSRNLIAHLTYQPAQGFTGEDAFDWQASDGTDFGNIALVKIQVWNTPPQVSALHKRTHWRQTLTIGYTDWLAAFADADGDLPVSLSLSGNTQQWRYNRQTINSGQQLPLNRATVLNFEPLRTTGIQRFFWNASDGTHWAEKPAELLITVWNTPPTVQNFSVEGTGTVQFSAHQFRTAYADADNDPMETVSITVLPRLGQLLWQGLPITEPITLSVAQLNELTYVPNNTTQPQADFIGWQASDGVNVSAAAVVRLTVAPVILPQVSSFNKELLENQMYSFSDADFATNYSYRNERPEFIRFITLPAYGKLRIGNASVVVGNNYTLREMAQLTYQPFTEFVGTDGFQFTAGTYTSAGMITAPTPATVTLQVRLAPISAPQNLQVVANRFTWSPPLQGNIRQYEVQAQIVGSENIVVHVFVLGESFVLPAELAQANIRLRVRAWGFHNNAGPFTEWLTRPLEIVANNPDAIIAPPMLKVFPNPASEHVFLQWHRMSNAHVKLIDNLGRTVAEWDTQTVSGLQPIDTQNLSSGIYHIQVLYEGRRYTCSFAIVKQ